VEQVYESYRLMLERSDGLRVVTDWDFIRLTARGGLMGVGG
jgi:hypothetical protein